MRPPWIRQRGPDRCLVRLSRIQRILDEISPPSPREPWQIIDPSFQESGENFPTVAQDIGRKSFSGVPHSLVYCCRFVADPFFPIGKTLFLRHPVENRI